MRPSDSGAPRDGKRRTYPRIIRLVSAGQGNPLRQLRGPALRDPNLRAGRVELGAVYGLGHVEAEDLVAEEVFARRQLGRDGDGPLGALLAEEVRGPRRPAGGVVGQLLDLDPHVARVALEALAVVVGAVGEVSAYVSGARTAVEGVERT
jgi:hypothetical protein